MADAGTSDTPRSVQNLARAIAAAARCRALYPREHPSTTSLGRVGVDPLSYLNAEVAN